MTIDLLDIAAHNNKIKLEILKIIFKRLSRQKCSIFNKFAIKMIIKVKFIVNCN